MVSKQMGEKEKGEAPWGPRVRQVRNAATIQQPKPQQAQRQGELYHSPAPCARVRLLLLPFEGRG